MQKTKKEGITSTGPYNTSKQIQHLVVLEEKMLENMASLQKVQVQTAEKFDKLASQISELLSLFESTARVFAQEPINQITDKDREFLEKINQLLEQNKTIAKGLTLIEEKFKEKLQPRVPHYLAQAQTQKEKPAEEKEYREPPAPSSSRPLPKF